MGGGQGEAGEVGQAVRSCVPAHRGLSYLSTTLTFSSLLYFHTYGSSDSFSDMTFSGILRQDPDGRWPGEVAW